MPTPTPTRVVLATCTLARARPHHALARAQASASPRLGGGFVVDRFGRTALIFAVQAKTCRHLSVVRDLGVTSR